MYLKRLFACLIIVSILTAVLPGAALADSNSQKSFAQALGIRAPQIVEVNQSSTLQTIEKHTQKAESNVAMYAVKAIELVRPSTDNSTSNATTIMNAYADIAKKIGIFLGNTDANGQLSYALASSQQYILIAIKDGFTPGFTRINVVLALKKNLQINAPNIAESGKTVTMTVTERGSIRTGMTPTLQAPTPSSRAQPLSIARFSPVAGASIYAIKIKDTDPINDILKQSNENEKAAAEKYATLARDTGVLLGATNEKGQLNYTFTETGKYVLVAMKDGYRADFTRIGIVLAEKKALRLNVVESAQLGQQLTIAVTEKVKLMSTPKTITDAQPNPAQTTATQKVIVQPLNREVPVAGASIYALPLKDSNIMPEKLRNADGGINIAGEKYLELAKNWFIGTTNADGKFITKFTDSGSYLIIAIKDGFAPDFRRIRINQPNLREKSK
jgi:hypothetical protein